MWFSMLHSTAFDMKWEKRLEENDLVRVFDTGSPHIPICLKFDTLLAHTTTCDLTQLFRVWREDDGMSTALTTAQPCLCIQIDRNVADAMNNIYRSECMIQTDEPCLVPVFHDQTLQHELVEYHVVALMAHIGTDQAGHIRPRYAWHPPSCATSAQRTGSSLGIGSSLNPFGRSLAG